MLDSISKNGIQLITPQQYFNKTSMATEKPMNIQLFKNASDLFEKNLFIELDERKKSKNEDYRRKKLVKLPYRNFNLDLKDLHIAIEKKQLIGRRAEPEKKTLPRMIVKKDQDFKVFYKKKKDIYDSSTLPKVQLLRMVEPRQFSAYETWKLNNGMLYNTKLFVIVGTYPDVRKALLQRGWVENRDSDSCNFDLKWTRNARLPLNLYEWQVCNHFPRNFELSVKWELYQNIKTTNKVTNGNYLQFIPRCFKLDAKGAEEFIDTFKAIFAVSMLKSYLEDQESYAAEQVIIANNVCKRWTQEVDKDNEFGGSMGGIVMNVEWKIMVSEDLDEIRTIFQRMMIGGVHDLLGLTRANLKRLAEVDPQFALNGVKNIWIVKAGRKSRGRDIVLSDDLAQLKDYINSPKEWVVQKYIENPMIIQMKKFDIRQWVLISSTDPLTIWIYKKSYLRFSIENYTDDNIENPYIHLTNNSISKKSNKFNNSDIKGCMWTIEHFQQYLIEEYNEDIWLKQIFPSIKKIVKYSILAVGNLGRRNSFEIFGYDFMIDENLKPWLIEINSSPAMDYSTNITETLVKEVLEDAIKVVVDLPSGKSNTGSFEVCYKAKAFIPFRKTTVF